MYKQLVLYLYLMLVFGLLSIMAYMFYSADANFTIYYSSCNLIILFLIVVITIIKIFVSDKSFIGWTLLIFLFNFFIYNFVFMGSIEKFLFTNNRELYIQTVDTIVNKNLKGYVDLKGVFKKLSRNNFTNVYRKGKQIEIYFGIFSSLSSRGQIVYTNSMETMLKNNNMWYTKYEILDHNWCIFYY